MAKSHMVIAVSQAGFDSVVDILRRMHEAVSVHAEYINSSPRTAIFIGEKMFFRTGSWASAVTIVKEVQGRVVVKVIATGGGEGLLNLGWGANKSYARSIIEFIAKSLPIKIVKEINDYNISKWREAFIPEEQT